MNAKIKKIILDILECDESEDIQAMEINSIKVLQIIMALDEEGIHIPLEKIAKLSSVGNLFNVVDESAQ